MELLKKFRVRSSERWWRGGSVGGSGEKLEEG
jgi:hypothetical protein